MQRPSRAVKHGSADAATSATTQQDKAQGKIRSSRKARVKKQQHSRKRTPPSRRICCCSTGVLFCVACCYLQVAVNVVIMYYNGSNNGNNVLQQQPRLSLWPGFLSKNDPQPHSTSSHPFPTTRELLDKLSSLSQRAERLLRVQQQYVNPDEDVKRSMPYQDDGKFLPFTIRDARRTVPTQIKHSDFHVLDFVNVHNPLTYYSLINDDDILDKNQTQDASSQDDTTSSSASTDMDPLFYPAPLFHNGFPVPFPYNVSTVANATRDCQDYSLACYRSNLLQVVRYLLEAPRFHNISYFFYMESDHDLCTSLNEIRSIAYEYQRYLIAAGTGTSGWIMSRVFLKDFYEFYRQDRYSDKLSSEFNLTKEDSLKPDVMAAVLLHTKDIPWSVTRRYLTSHTVLSSTAMGVPDMSLTELFEFDTNSTNATTANSTDANSTNATVDSSAANATSAGTATAGKSGGETNKKKAEDLLPALVPKKHLPRCLEPHRGILDDEVDERSLTGRAFDLNRLDLFDYKLCPDAVVFPCEEKNSGASMNMLRGVATDA